MECTSNILIICILDGAIFGLLLFSKCKWNDLQINPRALNCMLFHFVSRISIKFSTESILKIGLLLIANIQQFILKSIACEFIWLLRLKCIQFQFGMARWKYLSLFGNKIALTTQQFDKWSSIFRLMRIIVGFVCIIFELSLPGCLGCCCCIETTCFICQICIWLGRCIQTTKKIPLKIAFHV